MRSIFESQLQPRRAAGAEAASAGLLAARLSEQRGRWWPVEESISHPSCGGTSARLAPCSHPPAGHPPTEIPGSSTERLGFIASSPSRTVLAPPVRDNRTTLRSAYPDPAAREPVHALNEELQADRVFAQDAQKAVVAGGDWRPELQGRGHFKTTHASTFVAHEDTRGTLLEAAEARHFAYLGARAQGPAWHTELEEKERLLSLNRADFAPMESRASHQRAWTAEAVHGEFVQNREAAHLHAEALNFQGIKEKPPAEPPEPCKALSHMPLGFGPAAAGRRPGT